ncbi:hypothetical protein [Bosea sp. BH3]|uniref:hypothetical protein n=1 Tax=Bosea sp. BH3 TaxID=2871701 RepID=UPI0021CB98FE|nr:hypothetical protein [Bosea sp. BH3]MCU4179142.1 hypothetical protein [Bosea sp. BH3]
MAERIRVTHLLLAGGLVLAAQPALAQEGMLFKNLMEGVWGTRSLGDDIDYRARAPLVVPPSSALPRPQDPASARNAAWPNDPDVERRKKEASPAPYVPALGLNNNPTMSAQEIRRGRIAQQETAPRAPEEQTNYTNQIQPIRIGRELAARRNQTSTDSLTYGAEPPRKLLSEPPTGYRMPVGSAPIGPGRNGPVEDKQASGEREFAAGRGPVMQQ